MSSNHIFRVLNFAVLLFTPCAAFSTDHVMCGDCTEDNKDNCIIESDPGFYAHPDIFTQFSGLRSSAFPPVTADLGVCIPRNMNIENGTRTGSSNICILIQPFLTADDGTFQYICVWSRELGCNVIVPKTDTEVACAMCRINVLEGEGNCPCKK
ncbi:hypothetical protein KR084_001954, partial [Drosophila pseudotakahashii]